ncbi:MAG: tRNA (5-methylaminomethyl-2-thiouridine)(34)-methyltransferase MnmD [Bdellovibrio sp.]|nr:tRNA (5-methylaminomethyl-2-thiouridine)(34)-methyltransferase MnmD [Methylotenera sp.]
MTSQFANIKWQQQLNSIKQPYSLDFNDVYFNSEDGLAETRYVFIERNDLINRFERLKEPVFTVLETGFGSGLNFYCIADCWLKFAPKSATLRYFSIEKLPLTLADMQRSSELWPQFSAIANEFLAHYKSLQFPRGIFSMAESRIVIDLQLADINDVLPSLQITNKNWPESCVDAFLLDGFAPAKNPDMWSDNNLMHLARLASANATFATFTSASMVRKNLEKAGFVVNKHAGFGKKREMLAGYFHGHQKA